MKTSIFTPQSLTLIDDTVKLAKAIKNSKIDEFHLISKIWKLMQVKIIKSGIISNVDFDKLSMVWHDNMPSGDGEIGEKITLDGNVKNVLTHAIYITTLLECKVRPSHLLFGMVKSGNNVGKHLKKYGFTPLKIMKKIV